MRVLAALLLAALASSSPSGAAPAVEAPALEAARAAARRAPEDYGTRLNTAWALYRAGAVAEALEHYRAARRLSGGSFESRLGIAWSLWRLGRRRRARREFLALAEERPRHPLVVRGLLATAGAATVWSGRAGTTAVGYVDHPVKRYSVGMSASVGAASPGGWLGGATLRGDRFATRPSPFLTEPSFVQTELWLAAGYATRRWGLSLHYARIDDGESFTGPFGLLGLAGRFGAFSAQLSASSYPDMTVVRAVPLWRFEAPRGIGLTPGLAVQIAGGIWRASVSLAADAGRGAWGFDAGLRLGDELRPADVLVPVVFNVPDVVAGTAWLGLRRDLGRIGLGLHYAATRYRIPGVAGPIASVGHAAVLAVSWRSREGIR